MPVSPLEPVDPDAMAYRSAAALEAALNTRFNKASAVSGFGPGELRRQFAYDRLLSRLMGSTSGDDRDRWVLKGGVGLLTRLPHARHTTDVDLAAELGPEALVTQLKADAARDLGDFFTFEVGRPSAPLEGTPGFRVPVTAMLGRKVFDRFSVDLVTGTDIIGAPEVVPPLSPVTIPGLPQTPYLVYPLADTLADKTLATMQRYGTRGRNSTRFKDLVDIVLIATNKSVDLRELRLALASQMSRREVAPLDSFDVPSSDWVRGYADAAAEVPSLGQYQSLDAARQLAKALLDPALRGEPADGRWDPDRLAWDLSTDVVAEAGHDAELAWEVDAHIDCGDGMDFGAQ